MPRRQWPPAANIAGQKIVGISLRQCMGAWRAGIAWFAYSSFNHSNAKASDDGGREPVEKFRIIIPMQQSYVFVDDATEARLAELVSLPPDKRMEAEKELRHQLPALQAQVVEASATVLNNDASPWQNL
jgi:hypothetical protein